VNTARESFQRIGIVGAGVVSQSGLAARTAVKFPSAPANTNDGSPTTPKSFWNRILKISFLSSFSRRRGPTTTFRVSARDPGSSQSGARVSAEQIQTLAGHSDPNFSTTSPDKAIQTRYFVKFPDGTFGKPALQVKFERVWIHKSLIYSIKFSPDGKYLAVGVADIGFDFQKTYIYDVTIGRKIWFVIYFFARSIIDLSYLVCSQIDTLVDTSHPQTTYLSLLGMEDTLPPGTRLNGISVAPLSSTFLTTSTLTSAGMANRKEARPQFLWSSSRRREQLC